MRTWHQRYRGVSYHRWYANLTKDHPVATSLRPSGYVTYKYTRGRKRDESQEKKNKVAERTKVGTWPDSLDSTAMVLILSQSQHFLWEPVEMYKKANSVF